MAKPAAKKIVVAVITALLLMFAGCASAPTDDGQVIQMDKDTQQAVARILSRNVARVICTAKPELAGEIKMVTSILAGEGATVEALGEWTALLSDNMALDDDIEDLLIIMKAQGVLDAQFMVIAVEVADWVKMCARAAYKGCVGVSLL